MSDGDHRPAAPFDPAAHPHPFAGKPLDVDTGRRGAGSLQCAACKSSRSLDEGLDEQQPLETGPAKRHNESGRTCGRSLQSRRVPRILPAANDPVAQLDRASDS
jgi:hypothetical protein